MSVKPRSTTRATHRSLKPQGSAAVHSDSDVRGVKLVSLKMKCELCLLCVDMELPDLDFADSQGGCTEHKHLLQHSVASIWKSL